MAEGYEYLQPKDLVYYTGIGHIQGREPIYSVSEIAEIMRVNYHFENKTNDEWISEIGALLLISNQYFGELIDDVCRCDMSINIPHTPISNEILQEEMIFYTGIGQFKNEPIYTGAEFLSIMTSLFPNENKTIEGWIDYTGASILLPFKDFKELDDDLCYCF
jgi:hypothetical protein